MGLPLPPALLAAAAAAAAADAKRQASPDPPPKSHEHEDSSDMEEDEDEAADDEDDEDDDAGGSGSAAAEDEEDGDEEEGDFDEMDEDEGEDDEDDDESKGAEEYTLYFGFSMSPDSGLSGSLSEGPVGEWWLNGNASTTGISVSDSEAAVSLTQVGVASSGEIHTQGQHNDKDDEKDSSAGEASIAAEGAVVVLAGN